MNLLLQRDPSSANGTIGKLSIDGAFFCYTLEPNDEGPHPDIPLGTYRVIINRSTRFQRMLPLVVDVPGRLGIRIHPGNDSGDTEGCILLGTVRTASTIKNSRAACELFQATIAPVLAAGQTVLLTIENAPKVEALKA